MALSIYNLKKWVKMVTGNSILHVDQDIGKYYSKESIEGYYNDLTEKVSKDKNFASNKVPTIEIEDGRKIYFSIAIFQYGLGAYDLMIASKEKVYFEKFCECVNWTIENQEVDGSWKTFDYKDKENPYSSMAQGEAISLLIRAYKEFQDEKYLIAATNAAKFLITPLEEGGTTQYCKGKVFLKEFTNKPAVLNGWIFSLWGLMDFLKVEDDEEIKRVYEESLKTLVENIKSFDNGYWSKYDLLSIIASPFYHDLHIAQLKVMYDLTGEEIFKEYYLKWENYKKNWFYYCKAFLLKAKQKINER